MLKIFDRIYQGLLVLAGVSMVAAFMSVMLGIIGRQIDWNLPGLDAYAGYSIAAALFLALPSTFHHGDHIRVTLVLQHLSGRAKTITEIGCLLAGLALATYLCWFSGKLAWISYVVHDVSPAADVTPLWIPQISMVVGTAGFVLVFIHALIARWQGEPFDSVVSQEAEHGQ
jgi:TRAP-type C4-dicarboxylate transport system permease small subunit